MTGYVSLNSSVRTCKIDPAYATKFQSDRFLNPNNMVCPAWNGYDSAGRPVAPDSFMTKSAGCNSAQDRVSVENYQRPQYLEYVNLSSNGIRGVANPQMVYSTNELQDIKNITGNFGLQLSSNSNPTCGSFNYIGGMQQNQEPLQQYSAYTNSCNGNGYITTSGF